MSRTDRKVFRLGELFSGPGGIGLGAKLASRSLRQLGYEIRHQWAVDIDTDSCSTYRRNLVPAAPHRVFNEDVREPGLWTRLQRQAGRIDGLAFGFPCNDFSLVGEQRGLSGSYGPLYLAGVAAITHFDPYWFLAENVGGLHSANSGAALRQIIHDLRYAGKFGYEITAHLYRLEEYGVPQTRHRLIIVGMRKDQGLRFLVPKPTHAEPVPVSKILEDRPIPAKAHNHELTRQSETVKRRLSHIRPGENAWNSTLPDELQLNVPNARLSHIYRRLRADRPAYTLTASGGGGTHVYHWTENRALTNRERARLQTFPDTYRFDGSKESVRRQIGMAVPPIAARHVLVAIMKTFARAKYPHVAASWDEQEELPFDADHEASLRSS